MNRRLHELALEKQELALRSDLLRRQFAAAACELGPPLAVVDRLRQGLAWLRRHPPLVFALLLTAFVARPRALLGVAARAWMAWRTVRRLGSGLRQLVNRPRRDG